VTASYAETVRVWDLSSDICLVAIEGNPKARRSQISSAVHVVGDNIILGSYDGRVRVFTLTGDCIRTLDCHDDHVTNVYLNKKRGLLVTGSRDNTIKFWAYETGTLLTTFFNIGDGGYLWITPPDSSAPCGWLHTNKPELINVYEEQGGNITVLDSTSSQRTRHIETYNKKEKAMARVNDSRKFFEDLERYARLKHRVRIESHGPPRQLPPPTEKKR